MSERIHVEDEPQRVRAHRGAPGASGSIAPTAAVFEAADRTRSPDRGAAAAVGRAIDGLHASAGNGAIARLFEAGATRHHRDGPTRVRAARTSIASRPVVQASVDDELAPDDASATSDDTTPSALGTGAPTPGPSWTHVGPPTSSTYDVSGTLRDAANAVAARPEAGSVTTTPSSDTETFAPEGGTDRIIAARVTVDQVVELPRWTDRSTATAKQQAEWDRFHAAITTHEAGHVSTDKTSYAGAHAKMVGKAPGDADKALDAVEAKATTDNEAYDTSTSHGLTQGTGINPNIDEVTKVP